MRSSSRTPARTRSCARSRALRARATTGRGRARSAPRRAGRLLTVGGPPGVGRTEIAIELALALGRRTSVVLLDADDVARGRAAVATADRTEPAHRHRRGGTRAGRDGEMRTRGTDLAPARRDRLAERERVGAGATGRDPARRRSTRRRQRHDRRRRSRNGGGRRHRNGAREVRDRADARQRGGCGRRGV